jgi:hypothetical protein
MPSLKDIILFAMGGDKEPRKRLSRKIDDSSPVSRVKMEMTELVDAVDAALYRPYPRRTDLYSIYERAMTDPHVLSQVEIAKSKVGSEAFMVSKGGSDSDELTATLKKPWFENFLSICIDRQLFGYTLIEFGEVRDKGFTYCKTFPRYHVEPFSRQVLLRPTDRTGIPYGDNLEKLYLLELGEPDQLGLLQVVSREVIWKNFSRTDWSQCSEKFGMPLIWLKTAADDATELDRLELMLRNFASNGYIMTDIEDEVHIVESNKSDVYKIYEMSARFCDEQISKCINGQTGTSDEKAFVGSAEVHERILDDFHFARLRSISNTINYQLFPFITAKGLPFEGASFRFPVLDAKEKEDDKPQVYPYYDPWSRMDSGYQALAKKKSSLIPDWVISMPMERH